jgi:hypothetical protein
MTSTDKPATPEITDNNTVATVDPIATNVHYWQTKIDQLVGAFPDMGRAAEQVAKQVLARSGNARLNPRHVYWHWFDSANTSSHTYTGWAHYGAPKQSMTLVELVMRRFDLDQQRNSDLLAQMGGFYTADKHAHAYNEHNEVRLDPREVHSYFWQVDFARLYASKLRGFWINYYPLYCMVSKLSMLCSATLHCQKGLLAAEDFLEVYAAVVNDTSSPFRPEKLSGDLSAQSTTHVRSFDIEGIVSHTILRFCTATGREILYCAMQQPAFVTFTDPEQMYAWLQSHLQTAEHRQRFARQFVRPEYDQRGQWALLQEHLSSIANTPWKSRRTHLNKAARVLDGYAFSFLTDNLKTDMAQDADYLLISNNQLSKGLWLGYLDASLRLYSVFSMVGWPIAALSIAAGLATIGLYTDKAINAINETERNEAIRDAVLQALNVFLTLPLLSDLTGLAESEEFEVSTGAAGDGANEWGEAAEEIGTDNSSISPSDGSSDFKPLDLGSSDDSTGSHSPAAGNSRANAELTAWRPAVVRGADFQAHSHGGLAGLFVRHGYQFYAEVKGALYRVRYVDTLKRWAVVDPLNPYATDACIPLELDATNSWQPGRRSALPAAASEADYTWSFLRTDATRSVPLQSPASPIKVELPLDGIEKLMDRYMVRLAKRGPLLAIYDADERTWRINHLGNSDYLWRTPEGLWQSGSRSQWQAAAGSAPPARLTKTVVLPPLPGPSSVGTAIPKLIHYIWVGHELPGQTLLDNVLTNAQRMKGWQSILHVDLDEEPLLESLENHYVGKTDIEIRRLVDEPFFQRLAQRADGTQYRACRTGVAKNYAAASDVLRYPLIDAYGGIYMDVDNTFAQAGENIELSAGPNDILLDDAVVFADVPYNGYNSHVFASHADNPVLKAVSRAMQQRFKARPDFYAKPRPYWAKGATASATKAFWAYIKDTFNMTGPQVFDDVLRELRPDYYDLALRADLKHSLGIGSQSYEQQLAACVERYIPFASKVEVAVGNLHSWKSTR